MLSAVLPPLRFPGVANAKSLAGAVGLASDLWIRAKTVDQDERGNAERRALFIGLSRRPSG